MSSSRILSSRPSASCITAKPIARTIKGRGRNVSPFFAAQKQGLFLRTCRERCFMSRCPGSHTAHRWGYGRFRTGPPEVGKPRGLFRQGPPRALLYVSPFRKPYSPPLGCWRFHTTQPEVGKPSGLFRQSRRRHLLYGSPSRKPHSPSPGAVGLWTLPHRPAGNGSHAIKEKKRRKFPPLF